MARLLTVYHRLAHNKASKKKKKLCGESALPELFVLRNLKMIHGTTAGVFLLNYDLFPSLCD